MSHLTRQGFERARRRKHRVRIPWKFLTVHIITGAAFALMLSLGFTYIFAAANPLLIVMAALIPILDIVITRKHVNRRRRDDPTLPASRFLILSLTGFGLGMLLYLGMIWAVFSS